MLRQIGKWLNAGVLEQGQRTQPEASTPQGGVISPLLANVFLHGALDMWFEHTVRPRIHGRARLIRFADDFVLCEREADGRRVHNALPGRFGRFGLTLHPEKTRLVPFEKPLYRSDGGGNTTVRWDFLGFGSATARAHPTAKRARGRGLRPRTGSVRAHPAAQTGTGVTRPCSPLDRAHAADQVLLEKE